VQLLLQSVQLQSWQEQSVHEQLSVWAFTAFFAVWVYS
jgi:hypothetical protein